MAAKDNTLWVISELYFPEITSTGYYLTKIAEGLGSLREVKVICGQPNYSSRGTTAPKTERLNGVEIFRVWGTRLNKDVIPFRLLNMVSLGLSVFLKAIARFKRGDQVLVVTTPPLMPFIAAAASLFKSASYTLLIHDNYPDLLVAVNKAQSDSMFVRAMNRANRWLYKHAAKIIVVGRDMKELVTEKSAGLDLPVAVISNWAELESVEPQPRGGNRLLSELGLTDKFVVLYAGNMGHPNDVESIIEAAKTLTSENSIHFLFLGDGVKRRWIEQQIDETGLINITMLPPMPRSEQNVFLNACDVGIVTLVAGMRGVSMPSRTYNLMAAGKPILAICEAGAELDRLVSENGIGTRIEPGHPANLAESILEMSRNMPELALMGRRSDQVAISQCSFEIALHKYREELACR